MSGRANYQCPVCEGRRVIVADSRPSPGNRVKRRRVCLDCGHRHTTYEVTAADLEAVENILQFGPEIEDRIKIFTGFIERIRKL